MHVPRFAQPQPLRASVRSVGGGVLGPVALQRVEGSAASGRTSTTVDALMPAGTPGMVVLRHSRGANVCVYVVPGALPLSVTDTATPLRLPRI